MKSLAFFAAIGVCASAWLAHAAEPTASKQPATVSQAPANADARHSAAKDGYWCRATNGRWVWVPSRSGAPQALTGARRSFSFSSIYYGDDGKPLRIGGIDWYLNGRGPFSD
jgi:hypothetical protein